jgi:exodeoxyribonuclease-3
LFNIYFPNGGRGPQWVTHKLEFYRYFLGVAKKYMKKGRSVIVTGDVNTAYAEIDIARPKENVKVSGFMPEERAGLGEFFKAGLIDTFRTLFNFKVIPLTPLNAKQPSASVFANSGVIVELPP